jgi:putative transposase
MWTPVSRALVGNFGSGRTLSDEQYRLLEPLLPAARPGAARGRRTRGG